MGSLVTALILPRPVPIISALYRGVKKRKRKHKTNLAAN